MPVFTQAPRRASLAGVRSQIVGINTKVPLLDGSERPYIFFDNAASTPVLRQVLNCINDFMPWYSSVHRGSGLKSQVASRAYDEAREIVGQFFGTNPKDHVVIFGKNTTEAINKLSYRLNLTKKDVVLIGLMEHHSNDLPWRKVSRVVRIKTDKTGNLLMADFEALLRKYDGRIKLVSISGGSNVTGSMPDIHKIAKMSHGAGAQILVDCAQLAPHAHIDIKALNDPEHLDYIAISAHKMYAPFGTGALIGRRDTFETGVPELCGGGTIDVVTARRVDWTAPPDREEAGSPNVVGALALAKSLQILTEIGMSAVAEHEAELTNYALGRLTPIKSLKLYGETEPSQASNRLGVIPFALRGLPNGLVAAILSTEYGIGVRNGCFCAHPYVTHLMKVTPSELIRFRDEVVAGDRSNMPGVVRISFGMYNTKDEIDVLAEALRAISRGEFKGTYQQDKSRGDFYAVGWEPNLGRFFSL
jgi:cysteine desulfurase / selenocysteine lyase